MRSFTKSWMREREVVRPDHRMMESSGDFATPHCPRCGSKRTTGINCYGVESLRKCIICGHLWPASE